MFNNQGVLIAATTHRARCARYESPRISSARLPRCRRRVSRQLVLGAVSGLVPGLSEPAQLEMRGHTTIPLLTVMLFGDYTFEGEARKTALVHSKE